MTDSAQTYSPDPIPVFIRGDVAIDWLLPGHHSKYTRYLDPKQYPNLYRMGGAWFYAAMIEASCRTSKEPIIRAGHSSTTYYTRTSYTATCSVKISNVKEIVFTLTHRRGTGISHVIKTTEAITIFAQSWMHKNGHAYYRIILPKTLFDEKDPSLKATWDHIQQTQKQSGQNPFHTIDPDDHHTPRPVDASIEILNLDAEITVLPLTHPMATNQRPWRLETSGLMKLNNDPPSFQLEPANSIGSTQFHLIRVVHNTSILEFSGSSHEDEPNPDNVILIRSFSLHGDRLSRMSGFIQENFESQNDAAAIESIGRTYCKVLPQYKCKVYTYNNRSQLGYHQDPAIYKGIWTLQKFPDQACGTYRIETLRGYHRLRDGLNRPRLIIENKEQATSEQIDAPDVRLADETGDHSPYIFIVTDYGKSFRHSPARRWENKHCLKLCSNECLDLHGFRSAIIRIGGSFLSESTTNNYELELLPNCDSSAFPQSGKSLIILANVNGTFCVRIFDTAGNRSIDMSEENLKTGEDLNSLKELLTHPQSTLSHLSHEKKEDIIEKAASVSDYSLANRHEFWAPILDQPFCPKRIFFMGVHTLRKAGFSITKGSAWEDTLKDVVNIVNSPRLSEQNSTLGRMCKSGNVVIRFGITGAMLITNQGKDIKFYFDPNSYGLRGTGESGHVMGSSTVFVASLVNAISAQFNEDESSCDYNKVFDLGLRSGIVRSQRMFRYGYGESLTELRVSSCKNWVNPEIFRGDIERIRSVVVPLTINQDQMAEWSIVRSQMLEKLVGPSRIGGTNVYISPDTLYNEYGIRIYRSAEESELPTEGASLIILALVSNKLHFRVFDNTGVRVVEKREPDALPINKLDELKQFIREQKPDNSYLQDSEYVEIIKETVLSLTDDRLRYWKELVLSYAISVVRNGVGKTFNSNPNLPTAPVVEYGRLLLIAKEDIQTYKPIYNVMKEHLTSQVNKPMSIAVFGEPGTGKSFAIKEIAQSLGHNDIEPIELNIAQMAGKEYLDRAFVRVVDVCARGGIPLVFFDEFDAQLQGVSLGWIKYYLEPMQDGIYRFQGVPLSIGKAIFVFAGGTSPTMNDFTLKGKPFASPKYFQRHSGENLDDAIERHRKKCVGEHNPIDFEAYEEAKIEAKQIDFISRVRIGLNVPGINRLNANDSRIPYLRRAVILRGILEQRNLAGPNAECTVDPRIISILLTAKKFVHGARSMEAVVRMCSKYDDWLLPATFPKEKLLCNHVEGIDWRLLQ